MDLSHAQIERLAAVMRREVFPLGAAMCQQVDHLSQQAPALANTFYQCFARELVEPLRQANRSIDDFSH